VAEGGTPTGWRYTAEPPSGHPWNLPEVPDSGSPAAPGREGAAWDF